MPYAIRNDSGDLLGTARNRSNRAAEWIEPDDNELLELRLKQSRSKKNIEIIEAKVRIDAIRSLKESGDLPSDYPEPAIS